jgi:hypothetical protein
MLVDVGRRDSLDNALTGRVRPLGSMLRAVGNLLICCKHTCLPTNDNMQRGGKLQTLVALFQSVVSSVMPLTAVYIADRKCQNEQLYSDSVNHSNSIGGS